MPVFNNILAGSSGQATGYTIDQSLRFNDDDYAYLNRTAGTATSNDIALFLFGQNVAILEEAIRFLATTAMLTIERTLGLMLIRLQCLEKYLVQQMSNS